MIARQLAASIGNINESRAAAPSRSNSRLAKMANRLLFRREWSKSRAHGVAAAVRQLSAVVGRMRAAASCEAFTPLDFLFHQVIIDQCGNPLFAALFQASMSLYDQHIQAVNTRTSSEWALDKIVHLHEEIFRALEAFDLPACGKVLDDHYSEMD